MLQGIKKSRLWMIWDGKNLDKINKLTSWKKKKDWVKVQIEITGFGKKKVENLFQGIKQEIIGKIMKVYAGA